MMRHRYNYTPWVTKVLPFALLTFLFIATVRTAFHYGQAQSKSSINWNPSLQSDSSAKNSQPGSQQEPWSASSDLGVRVVRPVYAIIPETRDGRKNVTVVLTVWLKRVGARRAPYDLPHQAQDSIRIMVWADNPFDIHSRQWGHLKLPLDHAQWKPELLLETAEPGPILRSVYEPQAHHASSVIDHNLRPYSFRVDLPDGVGDCFKLIEASYPKHKAPICLPPARLDPTCEWLAPTGRYNATHPALFTTIGAVRSTVSIRDWAGFQAHVAARLWNYVSYQVAMGASGLLLYTDELQQSYLRRDPKTAELMRRGQLRLVEWDMHERSHDDDDGRGRPLGYNYDQALFASHVNLGLSACGANLWVIVTDIDEYLYIPKPNHRWPEPLTGCMKADGPDVTIHSLQRFDVLSSTTDPGDERKMWILPGSLGNNLTVGGGGGVAASAVVANASFSHPLELYDRVYARPLSRLHGKAVLQPGAQAVLFFVHDAVPLYGRTALVNHKCMVLLHVINFFGGRRKRPAESELQPFRNWIFAGPHPDERTAGVAEQ
ncbi:hypothetical protein PLESTB_000955000 [Pleodorina starrii]|uniref:Glycosyltransferase family 92 protein n=1 Tax=Pleodorina starrii TaxID=330485 RepID=A0A9W6BPM0_9CHLO|nr:hypothetical protein PLESTB_000955000 [Pleodorina starrii]GLC71038.1 hypothetical protein PLESTF_001068200 [Pleodorina starrii]